MIELTNDAKTFIQCIRGEFDFEFKETTTIVDLGEELYDYDSESYKPDLLTFQNTNINNFVDRAIEEQGSLDAYLEDVVDVWADFVEVSD